jgi:dolichol-phosphate mannosyltransferase
LAECRRYDFASITLFTVLDRASHDDTRRLLERHGADEPDLRVIWAPETRGVADAYLRGYREALAAGCDWILEIDAGFSHEPADIGTFLETMAQGYDCVFGSRFVPGGTDLAGTRRRIVSRSGTTLTNLFLGTRLADMTSGFELFNRAALEGALAKGISSTGPFFQTELKIHCRNLRVAEIPIRYNAGSHRVGGMAIGESLLTLCSLFRRRLSGAL